MHLTGSYEVKDNVEVLLKVKAVHRLKSDLIALEVLLAGDKLYCVSTRVKQREFDRLW